jgi:hypothetical protein
VTEYFEGDVVLHRDDDLPQTVISVEPMVRGAEGATVTFLRTALRFRPSTEFTPTALRVVK